MDAEKDNTIPPLGPKVSREGKRAWFTLLLVFLANVIIGMNFVTFSVLYLYFTDYFNSTKSTSGWIGSIQIGITQGFGIFISPAVSLLGCRVVAVLGSLLLSTSIFISSFTPNIWMLFITYGLVPGIGLSLLYLSLSVVVQKQFHKNRALANGISLLGLSTGNMVGPIVVELLVNEYGWRGALVIYSGISLHVMVLSLLFPSLQSEEKSYHNNSTKNVARRTDNYGDKNQKKILFHLLDFTVFKNPAFVLFCLSYMLLMFNASSVWNHIVSRAVFYGGDQTLCAVLVSSIATGCIVSRIICMLVANMECTNYLLMYSLGLFVGSMATFALTFTTDIYIMLGIAIVFGFHLGCSVTVVSVSAVYLLGVDKIARSQGFLNTFYGIAAFVSVPFTGWIFDITQNYNLPFYISGSTALFGSGFSFLSYLLTTTKCVKSSLKCSDRQYIGSMEIYVKESS